MPGPTHPEPPTDSGALIQRSVRALKWSYIGAAARIVLQIASQIVLARLLGPAAYGTVTAAVLVILIAGIAVELGLGPALVRAPKLEAADVRAAFTRVALAALGMSAIIIAGADAVALLFDEPQVAAVLRWMTLAMVCQALGAVSLGLLRRRLDFKTIQIAQVASYFVGFFLIGVSCAWLGAGVWSLVAAWVSQTFVASVIQYAKTRHEIAPRLRSGPAPLAAFGLSTVVASFANWSVENVDNVLVGRAFGTSTLGAYSISYSLLRTPVNHIVFSLQQVIMPFTARAQDDPETMRKAYLATLWAVAIVTMPTFLGLGALAPTAIDALYGSAWSEAIPLLVPLALAMPLQAVQAVGGPVLWGSGQVGREIRVTVSVVALLVVMLLIASTISAVAMAWSVLAAYLVRSVWITAKVSTLIGLRLGQSLSMLRGGLLVGLLVAALLYGANAALDYAGAAPPVRLGAAVMLGAVLLPLLVLALMRVILPPQLAELMRALLGRSPPRIQAWLGRRLAV
ncbi:MAG: lipopolysaccharide biosynthesis protein [Burkholderiales bacterium]|nr:lipopolysaccharide biosynthesis protein [Burkholderiales bacterium]